MAGWARASRRAAQSTAEASAEARSARGSGPARPPKAWAAPRVRGVQPVPSRSERGASPRQAAAARRAQRRSHCRPGYEACSLTSRCCVHGRRDGSGPSDMPSDRPLGCHARGARSGALVWPTCRRPDQRPGAAGFFPARALARTTGNRSGVERAGRGAAHGRERSATRTAQARAACKRAVAEGGRDGPGG